MTFRLLPFILMSPFAVWSIYMLFTLRNRFWYAASIVAMTTMAVFGFFMMFSGVVI